MAQASKIVDGKTQCGKCREWLPVEKFYRSATAATGLSSACKDCLRVAQQTRVVAPEVTRGYQREYKKRFPEKVAAQKRRRHIRTMYGVTPEWYDAMIVAQDGVCAICGQPEVVMRYGKLKLLAVDHDHVTDLPRGLLCQSCNQGIGHLGEDLERMEAAARYLETHAEADPQDGYGATA